MAKTADQAAQAWKDGMGAPQTATKYKNGINGFQGNPMQMAASDAAMQLYLHNVQMSVTSGKRAQKLNSVPVSRWRDNAVNVGATLLASGAAKALSKMQAHFQQWMPIYQQASSAAHALPRGGEANAVARVQAAIHVLMAAAGRA